MIKSKKAMIANAKKIKKHLTLYKLVEIGFLDKIHEFTLLH